MSWVTASVAEDLVTRLLNENVVSFKKSSNTLYSMTRNQISEGRFFSDELISIVGQALTEKRYGPLFDNIFRQTNIDSISNSGIAKKDDTLLSYTDRSRNKVVSVNQFLSIFSNKAVYKEGWSKNLPSDEQATNVEGGFPDVLVSIILSGLRLKSVPVSARDENFNLTNNFFGIARYFEYLSQENPRANEISSGFFALSNSYGNSYLKLADKKSDSKTRISRVEGQINYVEFLLH